MRSVQDSCDGLRMLESGVDRKQDSAVYLSVVDAVFLFASEFQTTCHGVWSVRTTDQLMGWKRVVSINKFGVVDRKLWFKA